MRVFLPGVAMFLLLMPALADGTSVQSGGTAAANSTENDVNQVVCKKIGPPLGSHLGGQTICQTKKKWLEQERNSQDAVNKAQSNGALTHQPGG